MYDYVRAKLVKNVHIVRNNDKMAALAKDMNERFTKRLGNTRKCLVKMESVERGMKDFRNFLLHNQCTVDSWKFLVKQRAYLVEITSPVLEYSNDPMKF